MWRARSLQDANPSPGRQSLMCEYYDFLHICHYRGIMSMMLLGDCRPAAHARRGCDKRGKFFCGGGVGVRGWVGGKGGGILSTSFQDERENERSACVVAGGKGHNCKTLLTSFAGFVGPNERHTLIPRNNVEIWLSGNLAGSGDHSTGIAGNTWKYRMN